MEMIAAIRSPESARSDNLLDSSTTRSPLNHLQADTPFIANAEFQPTRKILMNHQYEIEAFYDGECLLCSREVKLIRSLDRKQKVLFTNIADPQFDITSSGKSMDDLMSEMHARLPDGRWLTGVEVFRRLYTAVGFGWLVLPTRLPVFSQFLNFAYRVFARNRLKLAGRCAGKYNTCAVTYQNNEVAT